MLDPSDGQPPTTRLRLVSCRGVPAHAVLPLDGPPLSLHLIADLSPVAVPAETRSALEQCRIEPATGHSGVQWWLRNLGSTLRCGVNAAGLAPGEAVQLRDGDVVELGLVQIAFQSGEPTPTGAPLPAETAQAGGASGFRLADLGQPAGASPWQDALPQQGDSPSADIVDAFDAYRAAPPQQPMRLHGQAAASVEIAELSEPPPPTEGILEALHQQYLRLMRNPNDPQMAGRWAAPDVAVLAVAPGFEELRQQAASLDLYDILGHGNAIDPILQGLDTLSEHDILKPEAHIDVLRLFAPVDRPGIRSELPGLTRRDHHGLTADSAWQLQAAVQGTASAPSPESADDPGASSPDQP